MKPPFSYPHYWALAAPGVLIYIAGGAGIGSLFGVTGAYVGGALAFLLFIAFEFRAVRRQRRHG